MYTNSGVLAVHFLRFMVRVRVSDFLPALQTVPYTNNNENIS